MGCRILFSSFLLEKPQSVWLKPEIWFWGHIFPHICGYIGRIVSKNNKVHPRVDLHQPWNFMKIGSKLWPVSCVLIHKYISILTLRICYQGPPKRKTWPSSPPTLTPFFKRVRIVVISFRNVAKNVGTVEEMLELGSETETGS